VVSLSATVEVDPQVLVYLNRLSDLLFVAARIANLRAGWAEIHWEPKAAKGVGP
jgi:cob(I)alamin adenosyltransferase